MSYEQLLEQSSEYLKLRESLKTQLSAGFMELAAGRKSQRIDSTCYDLRMNAGYILLDSKLTTVEAKDPLLWFGLNPSLKIAQNRFKSALELITLIDSSSKDISETIKQIETSN